MDLDKVRFAVFTIQRFENDYLDEFICFYLNLGFERIYIYDNSQEGDIPIDSIVRKYGDLVYLYKWDGPLIAAHAHFNRTFSHQMEWLLILDVDEFLFLRDHSNIKEFVDSNPDKKGYFLMIRNFGSSGHVQDPKGLVIDNYVWCMPIFSKAGKSFIKIDECDKETLRGCCHIRAFGCLWEGDKIINSSVIENDSKLDEASAYINHYYLKSKEFLVNKKLRRGGGQIHEGYEELYKEAVEKLVNYDELSYYIDTTCRDKYSLNVKKLMAKYDVNLGLYNLGDLDELEKSYYYDESVKIKYHGDVCIEDLFLNKQAIYSKSQEIMIAGNYSKRYKNYPEIEWILNTHKLYQKHLKEIPDDFDPETYLFINNDVKISLEQASRHYQLRSELENRLYKFNLPTDFNWEEYIDINTDLRNKTELEAKKHYFFTGSKENRVYRKT